MSNSNDEHVERVGNDAQNAREVEIRHEMHEESGEQEAVDLAGTKAAASKVEPPETATVGNLEENAKEAASRIAENKSK